MTSHSTAKFEEAVMATKTATVLSHIDMCRTKVLMYRTTVLMACLTKVRR